MFVIAEDAGMQNGGARILSSVFIYFLYAVLCRSN